MDIEKMERLRTIERLRQEYFELFNPLDGEDIEGLHRYFPINFHLTLMGSFIPWALERNLIPAIAVKNYKIRHEFDKEFLIK